jgi:hypothetical protein
MEWMRAETMAEKRKNKKKRKTKQNVYKKVSTCVVTLAYALVSWW